MPRYLRESVGTAKNEAESSVPEGPRLLQYGSIPTFVSAPDCPPPGHAGILPERFAELRGESVLRLLVLVEAAPLFRELDEDVLERVRPTEDETNAGPEPGILHVAEGKVVFVLGGLRERLLQRLSGHFRALRPVEGTGNRIRSRWCCFARLRPCRLDPGEPGPRDARPWG